MKAIEVKYSTAHKYYILEVQMVGKNVVAEVFQQPKNGYMVVIWHGNKAIDVTYDLDKQSAIKLANRTVIDHKAKETVSYA